MANSTLMKDKIIHLAKLASMSLTDEEIERFQQQLGETLDYVKNLHELNTDRVKPTDHTVALKNIFFEDGQKNIRALSPEDALKNSKSKKNNYFVVKRIL